MVENIAVVIPEHTLSDIDKKPFVNRGGGGSYGATYLQELLGVNGKVTLIDENILGLSGADYQKEALKQADAVVATLVGQPYIPGFLYQAKQRISTGKKVGVAGPGIFHFSQEERRQICNSRDLPYIPRYHEVTLFGKELNIDNYHEAPKEELSNTLIRNQIPDSLWKEYLSREISMYLADGCKYPCKFCAVEQRTRKGNGKVTEKYRNLHKFTEELLFYCNKAKTLNLSEIKIYFSNLDILQSPRLLSDTSIIINNIAENTGVKVLRRGLPTFESIEDCLNTYGDDYFYFLKCNGLQSLGPGVDSVGAENRKQLGKGHNTMKRIYDIPKKLYDFGIITELLMVFCHPNVDTLHTLELAAEYMRKMYEKYGAIPRIHVAKSALAGTTGDTGRLSKHNEYARYKQLNNPDYFLMTDFLARPNVLSHPNTKERDMFTNELYKIEDMIKNWRYPDGILPPSSLHDAVNQEDNFMKQISTRLNNLGKYDH